MNLPPRLAVLALCLSLAAPVPAWAAEKPRLVVLTDIGGDPDDQQSMIRLMHYANEFDIEGLIASAAGTQGESKKETVRPELIREILEAYGKVRPNLLLHRPDYPDAKYLFDRVKSGNPVRGVKSLGEGHDTDGSRWITAVVDRDDPRPVNIAIWGGSTELAQALWRARNDRTPERLRAFVGKLRVYAIGHQDDTGPWINENFPDLFYILAKAAPGQDMRTGAYRGMYLGGDESLTSRQWVEANIRKNHGPLGALYPTNTWTAPNPHSTLKEGDTPSWFYFLPTSLGDPAHPEWGGWGGRFRKEKDGLYRDAADTVGKVTDARASVWRWRPAFQADFAARAEWCVKPAKGANHPPVPVLNGDRALAAVELKVRSGAVVKLSAAGSSDPDGDRLAYRWFVYPEAGTYGKAVPLGDPNTESALLTVPADAAGKTIHVILEVTDRGTPNLTRYRRAILSAGE
jgi:Cellulose-binding Sde182, nucleoside hydrolase-like domain/Cellulose-binding protein Sde0182, C-terminal domain